jgi:hypothetical protein
MMRTDSSLSLEDGSEQETILDRQLAAAHGSSYLDLAAFAIDIDRVYWLDPEDERLPFGWEVFLTEHYLLRWAELQQPAGVGVETLSAVCAPLLSEKPGEPPLGGQVVFAVYDAVVRGALPDELRELFSSWRHAPRELLRALHELRESGPALLTELAAHCLAAQLQPPLAATTIRALEGLCLSAPPAASNDEHGTLSVR